MHLLGPPLLALGPLLDDVASDWSTAVLEWRVPRQRDRLLRRRDALRRPRLAGLV